MKQIKPINIWFTNMKQNRCKTKHILVMTAISDTKKKK